mmetsp:Transcript_24661/g.57907  ORF Transcript_24661/g.57907 Transcript_24661/m.57907 type:complete len:88 (-) Transcript_24661:1187-1450(-)
MAAGVDRIDLREEATDPVQPVRSQIQRMDPWTGHQARRNHQKETGNELKQGHPSADDDGVHGRRGLQGDLLVDRRHYTRDARQQHHD